MIGSRKKARSTSALRRLEEVAGSSLSRRKAVVKSKRSPGAVKSFGPRLEKAAENLKASGRQRVAHNFTFFDGLPSVDRCHKEGVLLAICEKTLSAAGTNRFSGA